MIYGNYSNIDTDAEISLAMESVFEEAMESASKKHVITKNVRSALPDSAFGVIYTDENGKVQRKYPLFVKNDPEATQDLVAKAVQYFYYCKPEWKPMLAKNIAKMVKSKKLVIRINTKSLIFKYVSKSAFGPSLVVVETNKKETEKL